MSHNSFNVQHWTLVFQSLVGIVFQAYLCIINNSFWSRWSWYEPRSYSQFTTSVAKVVASPSGLLATTLYSPASSGEHLYRGYSISCIGLWKVTLSLKEGCFCSVTKLGPLLHISLALTYFSVLFWLLNYPPIYNMMEKTENSTSIYFLVWQPHFIY